MTEGWHGGRRDEDATQSLKEAIVGYQTFMKLAEI